MLVQEAQDELARRGYDDVRPVHDFAMRAIAAGAGSASDLGRRTGVTKQSAARTIAVLQERGYVRREPDPSDARRKRLRVTKRGSDMLREGEAIFDDLRERWALKIGPGRLEEFESDLATLVGRKTVPIDAPGWIASEDLLEARRT